MLTLQGTGFSMFSDITRIVVESRIWTETIFAPGHEGVEPKLLTTGRIECNLPRASAVAVQSKRGTESKDAARLNQDNQITVTYGGLKCQDVSVLAL